MMTWPLCRLALMDFSRLAHSPSPGTLTPEECSSLPGKGRGKGLSPPRAQPCQHRFARRRAPRSAVERDHWAPLGREKRLLLHGLAGAALDNGRPPIHELERI